MPKPLFTKLVAVAAIGFLCLLGGGVYGLSSGDRMLFTLSVLIGLCSLVRFLLLFRTIRSKSYDVLSGICKKKEPSLFRKNQQITFQADDGKEFCFTFAKSIRLLEGHRYNLYFRRNSSGPEGYKDAPPDLLGFEEIVEYSNQT